LPLLKFQPSYIALIFGGVRHVNDNVIKSMHCADRQVRARQVKAITSVLYFVTQVEIHTRSFLITNFEIHKISCSPTEYDKHFAIPSCINNLIWIINCCWRDKHFVKMTI